MELQDSLKKSTERKEDFIENHYEFIPPNKMSFTNSHSQFNSDNTGDKNYSYWDQNLNSISNWGYSDIHSNKKSLRRMNFHRYSRSINQEGNRKGSNKIQISNKIQSYQISRNTSEDYFPQHKAGKVNDRYIFTRLEQDLNNIFESNTVLTPTNGKINYDDFVNIMFHLGFIVSKSTKRTPFAEAEVSNKENKLLLKIWSHLKGKYRGYISLENIKVYLSAILNLELNFMFSKNKYESKPLYSGEKEGNQQQMLSPSPSQTLTDLSSWCVSNYSNNKSNATKSYERTASIEPVHKKTSFKSVGVFTTKGRFHFKNITEVK